MSRRKQARPIRVYEDEEINAATGEAVADTAAAVASPNFPTASANGKSTDGLDFPLLYPSRSLLTTNLSLKQFYNKPVQLTCRYFLSKAVNLELF